MRVRAIALGLLFGLLPLIAHAESRIALLIGNQAYHSSVGTLANPHNDIDVVGKALAKQGFRVLAPVKDAKRSAILAGVRKLVQELKSAETGSIGLVYYSGHGAAEKDTNINYLIPIDAREPGSSTFWDESLKLDDILKLLEGAPQAAKFIIFDACRNELKLPTKDTSKGLLPVAEQRGMFIAFATSPGRTATDKGDKSGPYAAALAAELSNTGIDHLSLFQNVKEAVHAATAGNQHPWESNGLLRRVYLTGPPKSSISPEKLKEAAATWDQLKGARDLQMLEVFIARFSETLYADLARGRLAELRRQAETTDLNNSETRARFGNWSIICKNQKDAKAVCAAVQSVTAEDRQNVGLTVYFQKFSDGKRVLRVFAPVGVLMPPGIGLKIDENDVGNAPFVRCQPFACYAQVIVDQPLLEKLTKGKTAIFIIFSSETEGIGIPVSLTGFREAVVALEKI